MWHAALQTFGAHRQMGANGVEKTHFVSKTTHRFTHLPKASVKFEHKT